MGSGEGAETVDTVDIKYAKEHLEELIARASKGEDVRIVDPQLGATRLVPADPRSNVVKCPERIPGRWKDRLPEPPAGFFDPLSEDELKDWYGDEK